MHQCESKRRSPPVRGPFSTSAGIQKLVLDLFLHFLAYLHILILLMCFLITNVELIYLYPSDAALI